MNTPSSNHPKAEPKSRVIPKAPSWKTLGTLAVVALIALIALIIGVTLASPIRNGLHRVSLVFDRSADNQNGASQDSASQSHYTCGMHPWVIMPHPGDCPICHMKLVPLDVSKFTQQITIDPAITQRIGVTTTPAVLMHAHRNITTTGSITWDESTLHEISLKYTGWIEKLHVDTVGQPVKKGQLLFEIYAPMVYVAQEEYLAIWRKRDAPGAQADAKLLEAARRRLRFLDVTTEQIEALEKRNESEKTIGVYSPADGYIVERNITQGASIALNETLYRIADISKVWVMAAIYEQDLPLIQPDMKATMTLPYAPGKSYEGSLAYVYPYLDTASRQASARLVFDNPDHTLKPGMFAQLNLHVELPGNRLVIPRNAVINTGKRQIAFVATGPKNSHFEPRTLTLGANVQDGLVEVLDGIKADENIVTTSQFLLDSESNMRQNLAMMMNKTKTNKNKDTSANATTQPGDHDNAKDTPQRQLSEENAAALNAFIDTYLAMSDQLAANENDLTANAKKLGEQAAALSKDPVPGRIDFWQTNNQPAQLAKLAEAFSKPLPLPEARQHFLKISVVALELLKAAGVPENRKSPIQQIECEMYQHNTQGGKLPAGGQWITPQGQVRNPYFGPMMLGCYTGEAKLPVAKVIAETDPANPAPADTDSKAHEAHE